MDSFHGLSPAVQGFSMSLCVAAVAPPQVVCPQAQLAEPA
jgi:hypothetical protein